MNRVFLLLLFTAPAWATDCPQFFPFGQAPAVAGVEVCYQDYGMLVGPTKSAVYSAERLTTAQVLGAESIKRTGSWHEESHVPSDYRAAPGDYTGTGYDRGHMTPAGDPGTLSAEAETFSMANVVPQAPDLNRKEWREIEDAVRDLAKRLGLVYVVTGPAYGDHPDSLAAGEPVPAYTWKAVWEPFVGAAAYLCTNVADYQCRVVPVAEVERLAGVDPFPGVARVVKATAISLPLP